MSATSISPSPIASAADAHWPSRALRLPRVAQSALTLLGLAALALALSGCGATGANNPASRDSLLQPYVPEVVQGNVVSREQRQALRPGMSRAQVRDILGTPLLASVFHADRWDYAFAIRRQGVPPQQFRLTVHFEQDQLARTEGDELPSEAEFAQRLSGPSKSAPVPNLQASEEQLQKFTPDKKLPALPTVLPSTPRPGNYPPLEAPAR